MKIITIRVTKTHTIVCSVIRYSVVVGIEIAV